MGVVAWSKVDQRVSYLPYICALLSVTPQTPLRMAICAFLTKIHNQKVVQGRRRLGDERAAQPTTTILAGIDQQYT